LDRSVLEQVRWDVSTIWDNHHLVPLPDPLFSDCLENIPKNQMTGSLSIFDHDLLRAGICPNCKHNRFVGGPGVHDGGNPPKYSSRDILCVTCLREYNIGILLSEIVSHHCPEERLIQVYGFEKLNDRLTLPVEAPG
jgi:hypothetical protein